MNAYYEDDFATIYPCLTVPVECGGPGAASTAPALPDNLCGGAEMADRTCSQPRCDGPLYARTLCKTCYRRARWDGSLEDFPLKHTASPLDRLMAKRVIVGDCWEFNGTLREGYGRILVDRRLVQAHRFAYESLVGPIPDGLQLDHLCRNRACFNPDHLEPVTQRENGLRGESPLAVNARKTHCPQGHPYDEENTIRLKSGGRRCRTCKRGWRRR